MNDEHTCLLCLGSNQDGDLYLKSAEKRINELFPNVCWGETLETPAEGGNSCSPAYMNRLALFHTPLSATEVKVMLKQIERENGRTTEGKASGIVTLDIDLLKYDDKILKTEDWEKSYVRTLLSGFLIT